MLSDDILKDKSSIMTVSRENLILDKNQLASSFTEGSAGLFPTDTLPALAASPMYAAQIWGLKNRPLEKPLILMASHANELLEFVLPSALNDADLMARNYWPGALTIVVPAEGKVVKALNPGSLSIGMRVPALDCTRELLSLSGPLATTSANLSGSDPCLTPEDAMSSFPGLPLLGPLPWPSGRGLPSTVIYWRSPGNWQLLRKGAVIPKEIDNP